MDFALWELMEAGNSHDDVAAVIRLNPSIALPLGVRMVSAFGDVVTCRVPRGAIQEIWSDEAVASFKAPRIILPEDDIDPDCLPQLPSGLSTSESENTILPTDYRRPPDIPETGQGTVMGFIDWGFDFAHPDFRNSDGTSRILAFWDQRSVPGKSPPTPYGYGVVHSKADINRALNTPDPYKSLGYHPAESDLNRDGAHATHVASIAAGNGQGGGPSGIAPGADLIFVHMSTLNSPGQNKLGDSVSLLEAVDFIFKIAAERPCVVNLSMGRHGESHDGTTLVEQAFDNLLIEAPGRAIVQSSGNYYNRKIHTAGQIRPGETLTFDWLIHELDQTPNQVEVWYSKRDVLDVEIASPEGDIVRRVALGKREELLFNGKIIGRVYHRKREPNNYDNHITIYLYAHAPAGTWKISLIARDVIDGRFNAWIERDWSAVGHQSVFREEDAVSAYTTGTICNGCRTIAVGAYNPHSHRLEMAPFSSAGPTRDGRLKPDTAAGGVFILAACSAPPGKFTMDRPMLTRKSGTSMAAPQVAGTVALMFEAAKRPLHIEETHRLLLGSAQWNPEWEEERNRLGSGYLDIERAVDAARHVKKTSPPRRLVEEKEESMERSQDLSHVYASPEVDSQDVEIAPEGEIVSMERTGLGNWETEKSGTVQGKDNGEPDIGTIGLISSGSDTGNEKMRGKPIELQVGEEKRFLLKVDSYTDARWTYTFAGETDSVMASLENLHLPPGMSDDDGIYQLLTITALSPGEARVMLTSQEKGKPPSSKKTLLIVVGSEPVKQKATSGTSLFSSARKKAESEERFWEPEIQEWQPWISKESETEPENKLIDALIQRIEAMETAILATPVAEHTPSEWYEGETTSLITEASELYNAAECAACDKSEIKSSSLSLMDIADSLIESGLGAGPSEELIRQALSEANISISLPSPAELFDVFANGGSQALHQTIGGLYDVVGMPGAPLLKPLEAGDILVRRALGEGSLAHAALVDTPDLFAREQLLQEGLTPESFTPGWYARVIEGGFLPHSRAQGYARRVLDWNGRVMPGQLVLRPITETGEYPIPEADTVNRRSADYVRWIQSSLNKILGLNLAVDGQLGPKTTQAIRTFQQKKGLGADGVVGPKTEQALIQAGAAPPLIGVGNGKGAIVSKFSSIPADWQKRCQGAATLINEFAYDKADLTAKHQTILDNLGTKIVQSQSTAQPITSVCLLGHTDNTGTDQYNLDLGAQRADNALKALIDAIEKKKPGLAAKIDFKTFSLGETVPVADEKTEKGRALNRRVAIFLNQAAKPQPATCFVPPVSKDDPTTFSIAAAGHQDFNAGSATILGKNFTVTGRVYYPADTAGKGKPFNKQVAAKGPVPIVFLAHGNHGIFSDPANRSKEECDNSSGKLIPIPNHLGYTYFQEMLAKMGIISVSVDCNATNCQGGSPTNIRQRAGLILASIKHFRTKHKSKDAIFGGRIDFSKTGLFGHSRGAEAVLVVPELLGARVDGISDVLIQGVISLAPTDNAASSGIPNGYPLMVILPAGDGDVVTNDGAKYYDQAVPSPFKCQLYIHKTNHNFFNREWVEDESHGPAVLNRAQHERLLSVYGAAFYRNTLLAQPLLRLLRQDELPPSTPTSEVHISYEEKGAVIIDDHENRNISLNALSQPTQQSGGLTAAEFDFSRNGSATFNSSFFGKTVGMVAQTSSAGGDYKSELGSPLDLTGKEIWLRVAEVYNGASIPAGATGFQIGLEDSVGKIALVDSNASLGGLPRPYNRKDDDIAKFNVDLTKTMLKTLRFPVGCFANALSGFDITKVTAIHLRLNRNDKRPLAFDQFQIV